jgi:hypothetical protein
LGTLPITFAQIKTLPAFIPWISFAKLRDCPSPYSVQTGAFIQLKF